MGKQIKIQEIQYIKPITKDMLVRYEKATIKRYVNFGEFYINKN